MIFKQFSSSLVAFHILFFSKFLFLINLKAFFIIISPISLPLSAGPIPLNFLNYFQIEIQ